MDAGDPLAEDLLTSDFPNQVEIDNLDYYELVRGYAASEWRRLENESKES
jgi:hypothetical protein